MAFPPVRTLIVSPSNWHSFRDGEVEITVGTLYEEEEYPPEFLVDGSAGPMTVWATTAAGVRLTFGGSVSGDILGIINHNLDPTALIQPYVDNVALPRTFGAAYPNCWIDLRAFGTPGEWESLTFSSIEIRVYGNSRRIAMSEIVVGDSYRFNGVLDAPIPMPISFASARDLTDGQQLLEGGYGTHVRRARLRLTMSAAEAAQLATISSWAGLDATRVVVVPSSRRNDIWLSRWPSIHAETYPGGPEPVVATVDLVEDAPGILV